MRLDSAMSEFRSSTRGSKTCLRLKASSWRVRLEALWPAFRISAMSSRIGSCADSCEIAMSL